MIFNERASPGQPEEFEMRGEHIELNDQLIDLFAQGLTDIEKAADLVRRGANINARTIGGGWTSAAFAAFNLDSKGILVAARLGADLTVKTDKGNTLIMLAKFNKECGDTVKLLRRLGAR